MNAVIPRRPPLIWFTQLLVILFATLFLFFIVATFFALPQLLATYRNAPGLIYAAASVQAILLAGLITLSLGLVRRRRWAWWGSIVFAVLLLALVVASRLRPEGEPIPILPIPPQQLFGAAVGDVVLFVALVAYPLRLFFSRTVRIFFHGV
jgi:hypothetical protein